MNVRRANAKKKLKAAQARLRRAHRELDRAQRNFDICETRYYNTFDHREASRMTF